MTLKTKNTTLRLPENFRKKLGSINKKKEVLTSLRKNNLHTVCEEAKCPNIAECFSNKTATFMIMGDICTRKCNFCSVKTGRPQILDTNEPKNIAQAAYDMGLKHVVITSVDRDELSDKGAEHFAKCIRAVKTKIPTAKVELLTPDFKGDQRLIDIVLAANPDVFGHNIETVERLYKKLRPQSNFRTTSNVLKYVAKKRKDIVVKSGMMVGLGESDKEVLNTLSYLKSLGVNSVTIGQYLRPSLKQWPVEKYVSEKSYTKWRYFAKELGFRNVFAAPFVRSSYHAKETYEKI